MTRIFKPSAASNEAGRGKQTSEISEIERLAAARDLHLRERQITLESVRIIGQLQRYNAHVNLAMSQEQFAARIGLTPNQLWKRAQAARVMRHFPRVEALVLNGEACISTVALLAPAITEANAELLLSGIKGKSKRDAGRQAAGTGRRGRAAPHAHRK